VAAHHDDVGTQRGAHADRLGAARRLADDGQVGLGRQEHAQTETVQGLAVDDEYGGHDGRPS
jgi:hypothetical protein